MRILVVGFQAEACGPQVTNIIEELRASAVQVLPQGLDSIDLIAYVQPGGLNLVTLHSIKMQVDMLKPDAILLLTDDARTSLVTVVVPEDSNVAEGTVSVCMMITMKHTGIPIDVSGGNKKHSITLSYLRRFLCNRHSSTIGWIRLPVSSSSSSKFIDNDEIIDTSTEAVIAGLSGMVTCSRERMNKGRVDTTLNPVADFIFEDMKKGVEKGYIANFCFRNEINEAVVPQIRRTPTHTIIDDDDLVLLSDDESDWLYDDIEDFFPDQATHMKDTTNDTVVSESETVEESVSWSSTDESADEDVNYCFSVSTFSKSKNSSTSLGASLVRKVDEQLCSCRYCSTNNTRPASPLEKFLTSQSSHRKRTSFKTTNSSQTTRSSSRTGKSSSNTTTSSSTLASASLASSSTTKAGSSSSSVISALSASTTSTSSASSASASVLSSVSSSSSASASSSSSSSSSLSSLSSLSTLSASSSTIALSTTPAPASASASASASALAPVPASAVSSSTTMVTNVTTAASSLATPTVKTTNSILRRASFRQQQEKQSVSFSDSIEINDVPYLPEELVTDCFYSEEDISDFKYELYLIQTGFLVDEDDDEMEQEYDGSNTASVALPQVAAA